MGFLDKMRNRFKMGKGRATEKTGRATGNTRRETKGEAERASGGVRQVTEQAKDAGKNIRKAFKP